jgi:hypothetical protein
MNLTIALFAWLISHQPALLFSQNKPAISNQPAVLFSQNKSALATGHQLNEQDAEWRGAHRSWIGLEILSIADFLGPPHPGWKEG